MRNKHSERTAQLTAVLTSSLSDAECGSIVFCWLNQLKESRHRGDVALLDAMRTDTDFAWNRSRLGDKNGDDQKPWKRGMRIARRLEDEIGARFQSFDDGRPAIVKEILKRKTKLKRAIPLLNRRLQVCALHISVSQKGLEWRSGRAEAVPLAALVRLMASGQLWRIRYCLNDLCGRWFYATVKHKQYCSADCQQKHFHANEEWRKHRAKYMRDYRNPKGKRS